MKTATYCSAIVLLLGSAHAAVGATLISDFSGGVTAVNHPEGAGTFNTWYDITNDTFGTPSAGTLAGSEAMQIDDGGFTNGVYAIFEAVIPADGLYNVSADILVNDTETSDIANYQIGAVVNGVHRGLNPSDLAIVTGPGTGVGNYTGLTPDVLDVTTIQNVVTGTFSASAGDNVLIAFGTGVDTIDFNANAGFWNGASVLVDNIMLNAVPEPASALLAACGLLAMGIMRRR